jgi:hypothetical protein
MNVHLRKPARPRMTVTSGNPIGVAVNGRPSRLDTSS